MLGITELGREMVGRADGVVGERLEKLLDRLEPGRAEQVLVGLEQLNHAMDLYLAEKFRDPSISHE